MIRNQVDIITMGCSKNLVDSEKIMRQLEANGYTCKHDSKNPKGEIVVINTCGFIQDAKEESINEILRFSLAKEQGRINKLFVMGCLSQRYHEELLREIDNVDKYYGKFDYQQLLVDLGKAPIAAYKDQRHLTTPRHYAYLKISEGCDRKCAYCAIPIITGRHQSRPMDDILHEVQMLADKGVKELQVIAQELTYYGIDIDGRRHLAELISRISEVKGIEWIRLHYAYPNQFPDDLLEVMRDNPKVCKYLDIALQHISDNMLHRMHRHTTKEETCQLISRLRATVPGVTLRTTMMVGFPGETDKDFQELLDFVRWARFERLGAFAYSEEEGTYSALHYQDDVPEEVKRERLDTLMAVQQEISAEIQAGEIGKTVRVVIDRKEGGWYVGRTQSSSPEVDPEVLIPVGERPLRTGRFYDVRITGSEEFDLYGEVAR